MISFANLQKKIERLYPKVLKAHVEQESVFPLVIPFDKSFPNELSQWQQLIAPIIAHSHEHFLNGYSITYTTLHMRKHGLQTIIKEISFDTAQQFIAYINKEEEYQLFVSNVSKILNVYSELKNWLSQNTASVLQYSLSWDGLLQIVHYFMANPKPGVFVREIPVFVHTKFIEQHKSVLYALLNELLPDSAIEEQYTGVSQFEWRFGLKLSSPRLRIRLLDKDFARFYNSGLTDIEASVEELAKIQWPLQKIIVLENKKNFENADVFLTLPNIKDSAVIFGSGKAVGLLAKLKWLQPIPILYWGDMDAEGFEMLHQLRMIFPQTASFCMDEETFNAFHEFAVEGSGAKERALLTLTSVESILYQRLCSNNRRLEQERISHVFMLEQLAKALQE